jgi:hypothetical protein
LEGGKLGHGLIRDPRALLRAFEHSEAWYRHSDHSAISSIAPNIDFNCHEAWQQICARVLE